MTKDTNLKKMFIITILFFIFLVFMIWVSFRNEKKMTVIIPEETIKIKEPVKVDYKKYDNTDKGK